MSEVATVANIKIRYDAKFPQFAIFETRVIYVFYSIIPNSKVIFRSIIGLETLDYNQLNPFMPAAPKTAQPNREFLLNNLAYFMYFFQSVFYVFVSGKVD